MTTVRVILLKIQDETTNNLLEEGDIPTAKRSMLTAIKIIASEDPIMGTEAPANYKPITEILK